MEPPAEPLGSGTPVRPLATELPFLRIPEDDFEKFCTDLVAALPDFANVHRHGRRGDPQDGIDAAADRAGKHVGLQYRRVKSFGPKAFKDTVDETTYAAENYVLTLGSRASSDLRNAVKNAPGWELWDADDLARGVRALPDTAARRLLDTYFGAHQREAFLGRTGPSAFHTVQKHFEPMMRGGLLFDHRLPLVGREAVLAQFEAFLGDPALSVAVLPGRGGIGKTRVLKAVGELIDPGFWAVLFADEHTPFEANSLDDIPPQPCVLFVDDGHRRRDIGELIAYLARRGPQTKLVIAIRPEGRDSLLSLLRESAVDARDVTWFPDLGELPRDKGEELAGAALGERYRHLARGLYETTRDCTMVTVVGARLLQQRQIPPGLLERDEEFRDTVLVGFRDASLGRVSDSVAPELARRTLELVSALQPVSPDSSELRESAAKFLDVRASDFVRALDGLEQAGVLIRRGYHLRVVPDVLADFVLGTACLTRAGAPTGYAEELFEHFAGVSFDHLLANLAEVDWRVRSASARETPLLRNIWSFFIERYERAGNMERQRLLHMLTPAAQYQPERILELAEWTIAHPAPDGPPSGLLVNTNNAVLSILPKLIERCAYGDHLGRASQLLWKLGRNDTRPTNQFPEHPIRILTELARYSPTTPLQVSAQMADLAMGWLQDPAVHTYAYSPLDVLETLLAKEGLDPVSDGLQVRFGQIRVNPEATRELRSRVIDRALELIPTGHPKVAVRSVRLLEAGLRDPMGFFGRQVEQQEKQRWEDEQLRILQGLREAMAHVREPVVQLRVMDAVRWPAARGHSSAVREAAKQVRAAVPDSYELRLTGALISPWAWEHDMEANVDTEKAEADRIVRLQRVAAEIRKAWPDPQTLAEDMSRRLDAIHLAGENTQPGYILSLACQGEAKLASGLAQFIFDHPNRAVLVGLAAVLRELRKVDEPKALLLAELAVDSGNESLGLQVASLYGPVPWTDAFNDRDRAMLTKILGSQTGLARSMALSGVEVLAKDDTAAAKAQALALDPGGDRRQAEELAKLLAPDGELFGAMSDDELDAIIAKFSALDTVEEYHTQVLLAAAARRRPRSVVRMLVARIDASRQHLGNFQYNPLPFEIPGAEWWSGLDSERRSTVLSELRDAMLPRTSERTALLPELFGWVAGDWGDDVRSLLLDWLESGIEEKIVAAARLLNRAPRELVFDEAEFIARVLAAAARCSPRASSLATAALEAAAYHTSRHRRVTIGASQDRWVRDRAREVAQQHPTGSLLRNLYEELARRAEGMMGRMRMADEEMLDGTVE